MLAGCDYVIMGAGIPMEIPGILDDLSENNDIDYAIHTDGCEADDPRTNFQFSPKAFWEAAGKPELAAAWAAWGPAAGAWGKDLSPRARARVRLRQGSD